MKKTAVYTILIALLLTLFCGCRDDGEVPDGDVSPDMSPIVSPMPGDDDDNDIVPGDDDDNGIIPGDDDEIIPDDDDGIVDDDNGIIDDDDDTDNNAGNNNNVNP